MSATEAARATSRPADRRDRILDEALRIFGQSGYHGFGLQELAERCGLTKAGLLHHFGSKDQLMISVLRNRNARDEAAIAEMAREWIEDAAGGPPSREATLVVLRAIVERNCSQPELVRLNMVLRVEALNASHPANAYFEAREAAKLDLFTEMLSPHAEHSRSSARQIIALMSGLEEQWLREGSGFDLLSEWDQAISALRW